MELSTERPVGMGVGQIPISKIWQYLDRFNLPDSWEPILLQADAAIVASMNKEAEKSAQKTPAINDKNGPNGDKGRGAIRAG
jgi:hypothetical protein